MRIVHISDLHLGLKLNNRDLKEDQIYILKQIIEKTQQCHADVMVIAGDLYDKSVPSAEAMEVLDFFLSALYAAMPELKIMMISGNHDNALRINQYRKILKQQGVYAVGMPPQTAEEFIEQVVLEDVYGKVHFYLLPFVKPTMVKEIVGVDENGNNLSYDESLHRLLGREDIQTKDRNVLVSHQFYLPLQQEVEDIERADSEICTVGNIDVVKADVLEPFDYAALGHIHKPMTVGKDCYRYVGTPLACSVSEEGQKKQMLQVDLGKKGEVQITSIPLQPLRRVRTIEGTLEEVLQQESDDYVTIVLKDQVELPMMEMQEQIRAHFPHVLEIRRDRLKRAQYEEQFQKEEAVNPEELCLSFFSLEDEESKQLLEDIMNQVKGAL